MRSTFSCPICNFRSTSEAILNQQINLNHEIITTVSQSNHQYGKKARYVENNSIDTTLDKHMKKDHKNHTSLKGQGSSQKKKVQGWVKN